jgi:hypothetical protein
MTNKDTPQNAPATVPESWKIPEAEIQKVWDEKADQFARFKEHFENK